MKINYLTAKEIENIHQDVLKATGGKKGKFMLADIEFLVTESKIPGSVERIGATLFFGILATHPFADGNKRTSVVVLEAFLAKNNKRLHITDDEFLETITRTVLGGFKFEDVVVWIENKIDDSPKPGSKIIQEIIKKRIRLLKDLIKLHYNKPV